MEFLDEDARPRFVLHSKPLPQANAATADDSHPQIASLHRPTLFISISLSISLLALSLLYFPSEPLRSILLWLSISLFIGPFAPLSITAGDIRVGVGPPVQFNDPIDAAEPENKKSGKKSAKPVRKPVESGSGSGPIGSGYAPEPAKINGSAEKSEKNEAKFEEKDWIEGDIELLRKLLGKNPVGKPGRWEAIAEGFKGRHRVESVIKKSKELGEKKIGNDDSYQKFLKDRKQGGDKRIEFENDDKKENEIVWNSGEDLALLNALKAFPKDAAMRWEKIAAAVPGKTKNACMKRMTELKRDFRSSKASS